MIERLKKWISDFFADGLFTRNRAAAYKRNRTVVRTVLLASLACMVLLIIVGFRLQDYAEVRRVYLTMAAVAAVLLVLTFVVQDKAVQWMTYLLHFLFVGLCTYSSAIVFPCAVCVLILSEMFIFPTLFLDKRWRINLMSILMAAAYLGTIRAYKDPEIYSDEFVNVLCFTLMGIIVGAFTRRAQLESFEHMAALHVSQERYRLAVEHNNGIICEFDVAERCVTMKSDVATLFDVPLKVYGVPYEPVKNGAISPDSSGAYIRFYEDIIVGKKTGTAEFCSMTVHGWRWQRAAFTTIFSESGEPISAVISMMDITDQRAQEQSQRRLAETDGLTGALNRAAIQASVARALSENAAGAFLLADLDNLKTINDTLGHPQGDAALCALASALAASVGQGDIVGRVGGDEFVAFVHGVFTRDEMERVTQAILTQLATNTVGANGEITLSASIGVAFTTGADTFEALYKRADDALYCAKRRGKNRCEFAL